MHLCFKIGTEKNFCKDVLEVLCGKGWNRGLSFQIKYFQFKHLNMFFDTTIDENAVCGWKKMSKTYTKFNFNITIFVLLLRKMAENLDIKLFPLYKNRYLHFKYCLRCM